MDHSNDRSLLTIQGATIDLDGELELCNSYEDYKTFILQEKLKKLKNLKLSELQKKKRLK